MSFGSEAAFNAPPARRHFNFSKALRGARNLLVQDVIPGVRYGADVAVRKSSALGLWFASPFLWIEENCDSSFDKRHYPTPDLSEQNRAIARGGLRGAVALTAFAAALFTPLAFSQRTLNDTVPLRSIVTETEAATPTYVRINSPEWAASRARLIRAYAEKRARMHPEPAPSVAAMVQIGPAQVTSAFSEPGS